MKAVRLLLAILWTQVFNIPASGINLENFNAKFFNIYTEAVVNRVKKFIYENL